MVKENVDIFSQPLLRSTNNSIDSNIYPSCLKPADITPAYKKDSRNDKANCRPIKSVYPKGHSFFKNTF